MIGCAKVLSLGGSYSQEAPHAIIVDGIPQHLPINGSFSTSWVGKYVGIWGYQESENNLDYSKNKVVVTLKIQYVSGTSPYPLLDGQIMQLVIPQGTIFTAYNQLLAVFPDPVNQYPPGFVSARLVVTDIQIVPIPREISDKLKEICEKLRAAKLSIEEALNRVADALECSEQGLACIVKQATISGDGKTLVQAVREIEPVWIENELKVESTVIKPLDGDIS